MPDNHFHTLLGLDPEISQPDYYQLLTLSADRDPAPEAVEAAFKTQMTKVQQVRSPRYKDLVEFLKGELKTARRTLSDPQSRARYEEQRQQDARARVQDIVTMFIQASGNLNDIEIAEIRRQAVLVNCPPRLVEQTIDEMLLQFGCRRVSASGEAIQRAMQILTMRAKLIGKSEEDFAQGADLPDRSASASGGASSGGASRSAEIDMEAEARKLQQAAARRKKFRLVRVLMMLWGWLFGLLGLSLGVFALVFLIAPDALKPTVGDALGAGGIHLLYGENPPVAAAEAEAEAARGDAGLLQGEIDNLQTEIGAQQMVIASLRSGQTPFELMLQDLSQGDVAGAITRTQQALAAGDEDAEAMADFLVRRVLPSEIGYTAGRTVDFSTPLMQLMLRDIDGVQAGDRGQLAIDVAGDASPIAIPMTGAVQAGKATLDATVAADAPGTLGLAFYQPGPDGPNSATDSALQGLLVVDLGAGHMQFRFDGTGASQLNQNPPLTLPARPSNATGYRVSLILAKADDYPDPRLAPSAAAIFQWMNGSTPVGDRERVSIPLTNPSTRAPYAPAANGRIALIAEPGTRATVTGLTVE